MTDHLPVRSTDPETSAVSAEQTADLAKRLRRLIKCLARKAGYNGLTGNEAEQLIPEHKNHSITPRFVELIRTGDLVRVRLGTSKKGRAIYLKRLDTVTGRHVVVNFCRDFVPEATTTTAQLKLWPIKASKSIRAMKKPVGSVKAARKVATTITKSKPRGRAR